MSFSNENQGRGLENKAAWLGGANPDKLSNNFSDLENKERILGKKTRADRHTRIKDLIEFAENLVGKECIVKGESVLILRDGAR